MEYIVTGTEMKQCDQATIRDYGIPAEVLMERAALACLEVLGERGFDLSKVLVLCGSGNNGGDGFAIARLLYLKGVDVELSFAGKESSCTAETRMQKEICSKYGINIISKPDFSEYTIIVDAIFGIGLSREVQGSCREVIKQADGCHVPVLAVDLPSGIHADTGQVMGAAIHAAVTVTFAFKKRGLVLAKGKEYSGTVVVKDIGIPVQSFQGSYPGAFSYLGEGSEILPFRSTYSNKGTFGKVLLIAGSRNMAGAALLAASAAYKAGAGLVMALTEECNRTILQQGIPEAITSTYQEGGVLAQRKEIGDWPDVLAIGPGLGTAPDKKELIRWLLEKEEQIPTVLDADALRILAEEPDLLSGHSVPLVITPHVGEMARLMGKHRVEILDDLCKAATQIAKEYGLVCVLKDAGTVVTDGTRIYINQTGNNGMSTGGSGDVLTGMIAGFLAQGAEPMEAACAGVYFHGLAGDAAAKVHGVRGMLASDIVKYLGHVLR